MDNLIYEDNPHTDIWMKLIVLLPAVIMLITAASLLQIDPEGALYLSCLAFIIGIIIRFIIPTKYSIYDSKITIRFKGPFEFKIPFETLKTVRPSRWSTVGINLPANFSQANALEIVRKRGLSITITPANKQLFIDSFEKSFQDWHQYQRNRL